VIGKLIFIVVGIMCIGAGLVSILLVVAMFRHPGGIGAESSVYLKRTANSRAPLLILGFLHRGDTLSTINLKMKWASPSHLEVTYDGRAANLEFQAVKSNGVEISVRDLSGEVTKGKDSQ
jgi:hypothetical protein